MINLIYASDRNGIIGIENRLPWTIPRDLKRFKRLTYGCTVIMGRKTYESLPFFPKGFTGRENVIVSRTLGSVEGCIVVQDLEQYLKDFPKNKPIWVIGGGEVYRAALPFADRIYHTRVDADVQGDTSFILTPEEKKAFTLLYNIRCKDDDAEYPYNTICYTRN